MEYTQSAHNRLTDNGAKRQVVVKIQIEIARWSIVETFDEGLREGMMLSWKAVVCLMLLLFVQQSDCCCGFYTGI